MCVCVRAHTSWEAGKVWEPPRREMLRHNDGVRGSPKSKAQGPMCQGVGVGSPAASTFYAPSLQHNHHLRPCPLVPLSPIRAGWSYTLLTWDFTGGQICPGLWLKQVKDDSENKVQLSWGKGERGVGCKHMARAENAGGSLPEPQKNTRQAAVPFCWGGLSGDRGGGRHGGGASETDTHRPSSAGG